VLIPGRTLRDTVALVDTNVMIEAVRVRCWNALSGALRLETVAECRDEAGRGDRSRPGYVPVSEADLARLSKVHPVTDLERAVFGLAYGGSQNMDGGERDLFAHAYARSSAGDPTWVICSPDRASIRAAVALGWRDQTRSLGELAAAVGARPNPPLADHFGERWLSDLCTAYLLGR
jgi:hypothetical protein